MGLILGNVTCRVQVNFRHISERVWRGRQGELEHISDVVSIARLYGC